MRVSTVPCCCWGFLAGIVGTLYLMNIHEGQHRAMLLLGIPGCCRRNTSTENNKAVKMADDAPRSQWCEKISVFLLLKVLKKLRG